MVGSSAVRDAATVALLRDGAAGIEVFLLRRVAGMAFAGGMTVFPGGSVDPSDGVDSIGWTGPEPAAWSAALSAGERLSRALVCAAVRETFEESGVLLAGSGAGATDADRLGLERHELTLAQLLTRLDLPVRADLLRPWAHWITPEDEPRRYDTRFFIAALPPGQEARDGTSEAEVAEWVRPADALTQHAAGRRAMLPPTVVTLRELAAFAIVAGAWAAAADREIMPIMPRLSGSTAILPDGEAIGLP
ncbi:MAG TPA: NUDIX hydrolase [Mycobacteriales bacterium]|jgi:8-oxo-dGTP pyrophosphatase MutT (NUDIX family)|nr:NUDIX hydrolase [Mycobacteriales bacterium]